MVAMLLFLALLPEFFLLALKEAACLLNFKSWSAAPPAGRNRSHKSVLSASALFFFFFFFFFFSFLFLVGIFFIFKLTRKLTHRLSELIRYIEAVQFSHIYLGQS